MYNYFQTYNLNANEIEKINLFLSAQKSVSFEQSPLWNNNDNRVVKPSYFYVIANDEVVAYAKVQEKKLNLANIVFGPLARDTETMIICLEKILSFYKQRKFVLITIQPDFFFDQYSVSENLSSYKFIKKPSLLNWATLQLNLQDTLTNIFENFSSHHKKEIKRGIKAGLHVQKIEDENSLSRFCDIYTKMYTQRKLSTNHVANKEKFEQIFKYINQQQQGFMLGVYNVDNVLICGVTVIYQGNSAFYYIGASDPDFKKLPMNYIAMQKAIEIAKEDNMAIFDFGGYKLDVEETDQVFHINWFKKGFGGNLVIYPKTIIIPLNQLYYKVYSTLLALRNYVKGLKYKD